VKALINKLGVVGVIVLAMTGAITAWACNAVITTVTVTDNCAGDTPCTFSTFDPNWTTCGSSGHTPYNCVYTTNQYIWTYTQYADGTCVGGSCEGATWRYSDTNTNNLPQLIFNPHCGD
jgi:hypothetical protein